ncbi:hypothetical protein A6A19_00820 [Actinobacillus delphinicola]|uniref:hypothetical protein n=1 Tax=Actinobacillus delphinicola TaxID=51161 RepID=UPI002442A56E|nr:hypothetical protein [Actinobacillus delphinicola]MDG6896572.1 hypothetical protein [Actinobacillus delphinicola]
MIAPKKKAEEIYSEVAKQLNEFTRRNAPIASNELAEAKRLAEKLMYDEEFKSLGYSCLGMISALQGNEDDCVNFFDKYVQFGTAPNISLYCSALSFLGEIKKSCCQIDAYIESGLIDPQSLLVCLKLCSMYGQISRGTYFMEYLEKLRLTFTKYDGYQAIIDSFKTWSIIGIKEDEVVDFLDYVFKFLFTLKTDLRKPHFFVDEEDNEILFIIPDHSSFDEQTKKNRLLDKYILKYLDKHPNFPVTAISFIIGDYVDD